MTNAKTDSLENGLLLLIFNNDAYTLVGDAAGLLGSTADGSLYISMHTADPGEAGTQSTNETTYTGYARQAVARTTGGWTVTNNQVVNAAEIAFPQSSSGAPTITHIGVGTDSTGAGKLLYRIDLTTSLPIVVGVTTPTLPATTGIVITED